MTAREIRVYAHHVRAAHICMAGTRKWFTAHGFDWSDFLDNGMSGELLRELDDPISNRALAVAEAEAAAKGLA